MDSEAVQIVIYVPGVSVGQPIMAAAAFSGGSYLAVPTREAG